MISRSIDYFIYIKNSVYPLYYYKTLEKMFLLNHQNFCHHKKTQDFYRIIIIKNGIIIK